GTAGPVSVQYTTEGGTAIAGTDYTAVSGTLNFPDGASSETINVPVLNNPNPAGDVTVDLALSNPTGGAALGTGAITVLTINQGKGVFRFSAPTYVATQNGGALNVTVTRTYGTAGAASVQYATSDGTAKAGTDYNATSGTLDFADGVNSQ